MFALTSVLFMTGSAATDQCTDTAFIQDCVTQFSAAGGCELDFSDDSEEPDMSDPEVLAAYMRLQTEVDAACFECQNAEMQTATALECGIDMDDIFPDSDEPADESGDSAGDESGDSADQPEPAYCEDDDFMDDCVTQAIDAGLCELLELHEDTNEDSQDELQNAIQDVRRRLAQAEDEADGALAEGHDETLEDAGNTLARMVALSFAIDNALSTECKACDIEGPMEELGAQMCNEEEGEEPDSRSFSSPRNANVGLFLGLAAGLLVTLL